MYAHCDIEVLHDSSDQVTLKWKKPTEAISRIKVKVLEKCTYGDSYDEVYESECDPSFERSTCTGLTKGQSYRVEIIFVKPTLSRYPSWPSDQENNTMIYQNFRAVYSFAELKVLHEKAVTFIRNYCLKQTCPNFTRNKPPCYYDYIMKYQDGIMRPYTKDNHGDPCNPANLQLPGLFFSADPNPSFQSHFGTRRLLVKASVLFNNETNLYFSDFYCNRYAHYVTLVLTKKGSHADSFCNQHLYKREPSANPFLTLDQNPLHCSEPQMKVVVEHNFWVEVFYTENVHIQTGPFCTNFEFQDVMSSGSTGHSRYEGIAKNTCCGVCNL